MLKLWELRVVPPGTVGSPGPSKRNGDGETNRVDCVRTVHKTVNVLDKLPKSVQPAAKADLREVWNAPDRATAEAAIATFAEKYGAKYEKAVACLTKDQDALLTFYDFPASTGTTCARPTRSRACSPRSGTAPCGPRARCRRTAPA